MQSTGAVTDLLCGFNLDNPYIKAVVKAMKQNIPAGSDVVSLRTQSWRNDRTGSSSGQDDQENVQCNKYSYIRFSVDQTVKQT